MIFVIAILLALTVMVVFNFLLILALVQRVKQIESADAIKSLEVGEKAPPFETRTLGGKLVNLNELSSRGILMVFMSPSCSPCISQVSEIATLVPKIKAAQRELLLVSDGDATGTQQLIAGDRTIDPLLDVQSGTSMWRDYNVPGTPFFYMIDNRRQVSASGFIGADFTQKVLTWLNSDDYVR